jgi:hypothetical protein
MYILGLCFLLLASLESCIKLPQVCVQLLFPHLFASCVEDSIVSAFFKSMLLKMTCLFFKFFLIHNV